MVGRWEAECAQSLAVYQRVLAVSARGHIEYYLYGLSKYWVLEIPMLYAVFFFDIKNPFGIK